MGTDMQSIRVSLCEFQVSLDYAGNVQILLLQIFIVLTFPVGHRLIPEVDFMLTSTSEVLYEIISKDLSRDT